jgi:multidrug resistance efflux pump
MNTYLKKPFHFVQNIYRKASHWFKQQSKRQQIGTVLILVAVLAAIVKILFSGHAQADSAVIVPREVKVASVASFAGGEGNFPLIGTVTSVSEATIRAEGSGKLVKVYKKLGDNIGAGGVIGEFENSAERAAVLQAQGAYEQAKASRDIVALNSNQAGSSLGDTKTQALNTISNSYMTMDDAIHGKTDSAYTNPKFQQVKLAISVPDANLASDLEAKRKTLENMLTLRKARDESLTTDSNLMTELATTEGEVQTVKLYLDDLSTAYSKAIPDANYSTTGLEAGKANLLLARQAIASILSSVVTAKTSLSSSMTANQVAGNQGVETGAIASAEAQVKQALGAYDGALARLEKTIIRSPITGTLNSLTISTGDYISAFTQVAVVSNNGALEVISFVNEDDAKRVMIGAPVTINSTVEGVVTRIAQAIDPTTKKIEVRIGIKDSKSTLVNGQSVRVVITQDKKDKKTPVSKDSGGPIIIPIAALKLTPRGGNVFTVSATNTLIALPVKEGAILGEEIQILEGLTGNETIVMDARGLKEGQVVHVVTK